MANPLLDRRPPAELAGREQAFEIEGNISDFPRLVEVVDGELRALPEAAGARQWRGDPVLIRLAFGWLDPANRLPRATGSIKARLASVCQRCLEPFDLELEVPVDVVFGDEDDVAAAGGVPSGQEVWELDDEQLSLRDLVEEWLIMSLPLAPMHDDETSCSASAANRDAQDKVRPFADLKSLMADKEN